MNLKKYLTCLLFALLASVWGCSDMGERDNPTDPSADNYDASLVPGGDDSGNGGDSGNGSEGNGEGGDSGNGGESSGNEGGNSSGLDGRVSSSSVQATSSSMNAPFANTDLPCGDLWCGPKHEYSVRTGFASDDNKPVGAWYHYIDDDNGGNSHLDFPGFEGDYNVDFDNVIDKCGGICGSAYLGEDYENRYVGFGFFTLNSWTKTADITSWNGICVSYVSDNKITLAVLPTEKVEAAMKWDHFVLKLPASKTGSVVDIPWSKFAQSGWGVKYDREEILKQVTRIAFEIKDIAAGTTVNFNIVSIGRLGSCTDGSGGSSAGASSSSAATSSSSSANETSSSTAASSSSVTSQSSSSIMSVSMASMTDERDGQTYKTVKIGDQTWMAENLNYEIAGSFCYGDDTSNCTKYGRLYYWSSALNACPNGWHLPSQMEWNSLMNEVGGSSSAGKFLKSKNGWLDNGNGLDGYSFSALPAGEVHNGSYSSKEQCAFFWSSTENSNDLAYALYLYSEYDIANVGLYGKNWGESVRCLKDTSSSAVASSSSSEGNFCAAAGHSGTSAGVIDTAGNETIDGNTYELTFENGTNSLTYYQDGSFTCSAKSTSNFLCSAGKLYEGRSPSDEGRILAEYSFTAKDTTKYSPYVGAQIVSTAQYQIMEFISNRGIITDYYTKVGEYTVDGVNYALYGNSSYYYALREENSTCGTVDVSAHLAEWLKMDVAIGDIEKVAVFANIMASGLSNGTIDFTHAKVYLEE